MTPLRRFLDDQQYILQKVSEATGIEDPVAIDLDDFTTPLMLRSTRGAVLPLDGVLIRDWDPDFRKFWPGLRFGIRLYELDGITFARVVANVLDSTTNGYDFYIVAKANYRQLYKHALKARGNKETPIGLPPVLPGNLADLLKRNSVDYLSAENLKRIKEYGGRPKRGLLLVGPPGNGKTSACRWIWNHCQHLGLDFRFVGPDDYRSARNNSNPADAVKRLFQFGRSGIVFFDDFDIALRDRDKGYETDDQAVFLSALDGIEPNEGVVYIFTTNCDLSLIDPAIRRPGRIDVVLQFPNPDASLRESMVKRWHTDIQKSLDIPDVVEQTDGLSFAELDELKNLMVMRYMDINRWEWDWAVKQFEVNRRALGGKKNRGPVGFAAAFSLPTKRDQLQPSVNCTEA
jgi:cell division protease FtsH